MELVNALKKDLNFQRKLVQLKCGQTQILQMKKLKKCIYNYKLNFIGFVYHKKLNSILY